MLKLRFKQSPTVQPSTDHTRGQLAKTQPPNWVWEPVSPLQAETPTQKCWSQRQTGLSAPKPKCSKRLIFKRRRQLRDEDEGNFCYTLVHGWRHGSTRVATAFSQCVCLEVTSGTPSYRTQQRAKCFHRCSLSKAKHTQSTTMLSRTLHSFRESVTLKSHVQTYSLYWRRIYKIFISVLCFWRGLTD